MHRKLAMSLANTRINISVLVFSNSIEIEAVKV